MGDCIGRLGYGPPVSDAGDDASPRIRHPFETVIGRRPWGMADAFAGWRGEGQGMRRGRFSVDERIQPEGEMLWRTMVQTIR